MNKQKYNNDTINNSITNIKKIICIKYNGQIWTLTNKHNKTHAIVYIEQ